jgi:hypothetical protein
MYINSFGNIRPSSLWQRIKDSWRGFWAACKQFKFFDFVKRKGGVGLFVGFLKNFFIFFDFVADHGMPNYIQHVDNLDEETPQVK